VYSIFYLQQKNIFLKSAVAALLIGFASGSKYFPLVMAPLPILVYLSTQKISVKSMLDTMILITLLMAPLTTWLTRSYLNTTSPVFPFFQQYFPTPKYWDASDHLEGNFMIQTTMSTEEWVRGGFFTYPLKSYLNSSQFIEGTKGYPGFVYLFFIPIQIILLIKLIYQIIKGYTISSQEKIFIYSFLSPKLKTIWRLLAMPSSCLELSI
jgi:hypothetical protein